MISTLRKTALAAVLLAGTAGFACAQTSIGAGSSTTGTARRGHVVGAGGTSVGTGAGTSSTLGLGATPRRAARRSAPAARAAPRWAPVARPQAPARPSVGTGTSGSANIAAQPLKK